MNWVAGIDFGPNLSEIGAKLAKEALYGTILDPSAGISFGFELWEVTLQNREIVTGILASDASDELALKVQTGLTTRHQQKEVAAKRRLALSIMPAGLQEAMTTQELVDLAEYLGSLKKTRKSVVSRE